MKDWIRLSLAWDGILPFLTTAVPFIVACNFPGDHVATVCVFLGLPMFLALIRAVVGHAQIQSRCGGEAPALRQIAMAFAITLLMLVDAIAVLLVMAPVELLATLLPAAGLYVGYLFFVALALAPSPATQEGTEGFKQWSPVPSRDPLEV